MALSVQPTPYGNAMAGGLRPPGERDTSTLTHRTTAAAGRALPAEPAGDTKKTYPVTWSNSDAVNGCKAMSVFAASMAVLAGAVWGINYLVSSNNQ